MKYFSVVFVIILFPTILLGQSSDSLKANIANMEAKLKIIESKMDSLEIKKINLRNNIAAIRRIINKKQTDNTEIKSMSTKINWLGGTLFDKPSAKSVVLAKIQPGEKVLVFNWYQKPYFKISYNGNIGYIAFGSLEKNWLINQALAQSKVKKMLKLKKTNPEFARLIKKYGKDTARRLMYGEIWIGMTKEMVRESIGNPSDINKTVTSYGTREQWLYKGNKYLYFQGNVLKSWQDW